MKKSILLIGSIIALFACNREKDPIDTGSAIVFGKEDISPDIVAPCTVTESNYILDGQSTYLRTPIVNSNSNGYSIWADELFNSTVTISLSQKPTKFPDTLRFDGNTKSTTYIKNVSFYNDDDYNTYTPDYTNITTPIYLYINKKGGKVNYQFCSLPIYTYSNYYGRKTATLSVNIPVNQ